MIKAMNPKMKSRSIATALKQKIRSQKLTPGSPLPSARDLARQYQVCMMTANRALDILEKESIIIRRKGRGNFVQRNIIRGASSAAGDCGYAGTIGRFRQKDSAGYLFLPGKNGVWNVFPLRTLLVTMTVMEYFMRLRVKLSSMRAETLRI